MPDIFHTLAEVAVAITGFSSLVVIFRGAGTTWRPQDYVGLSFVLSWSIGGIFLSLLPIVAVEFGASVPAASKVGLFAAVVYMTTSASILTVAQRRVSRSGGGEVPTHPRLLMGVSFLAITLIALTAGLELLPGAPHAWLAATVVLLLAHATADLGVFVVQTTRRSSR